MSKSFRGRSMGILLAAPHTMDSAHSEPVQMDLAPVEPAPCEPPQTEPTQNKGAQKGSVPPAKTAVSGNVILAAIVAGAVAVFAVIAIASRHDAAPASSPDRASTREAARVPASASTSAAAVDSPSSPVSSSHWVRTRQPQWATDGSRTMGFELAAERDVAVFRDRVRPILAARCISRQIQMFVVLGASLSVEGADDRHSVTVGIDDEPEAEQRWEESADKQGVFAPDGRSLADRLVTAHTLRFGFTPYSARRATAEFNVSGFDQPLAAMARACNLTTVLRERRPGVAARR